MSQITERTLQIAERLRHAHIRETHVVVGDHDPEPRINHMRLDSYDANGHYGADDARLSR